MTALPSETDAMLAFETLAVGIVTKNDGHLCDSSPSEQIATAVKQFQRFTTYTPLVPISGLWLDLAGFGQAQVRFASADDRYLLLSDLAEQLGMQPWTACDWAQQEYWEALSDQREADEKRGDGRLGYDMLRDHLDLRFLFVADDPQANPDAGGRRSSCYGDWLISSDRIMSLILASPWSQEFMNNTRDHMRHAARKVWGGAFGELFATDVSEEEAARRAVQGPGGVFGEPA